MRRGLTIAMAATLLSCPAPDAAAQTPPSLLGTWSTKKGLCSRDVSPEDAIIYEFAPDRVSFYEIDCHVREAKSVRDGVEFDVDCVKGGGSRWFDKLTVRAQSPVLLSTRFRKMSYIKDRIHYCGPLSQEQRTSKVTRWMHNRSVMTMEESNSDFEISYEQPRSGMAAVGVRRGTMLLFGLRNGASFQGTAYIFHPRCGPARYDVEGEALENGRALVFSGQRPKLNAACEPAGEAPDRLRFEKLD